MDVTLPPRQSHSEGTTLLSYSVVKKGKKNKDRGRTGRQARNLSRWGEDKKSASGVDFRQNPNSKQE